MRRWIAAAICAACVAPAQEMVAVSGATADVTDAVTGLVVRVRTPAFSIGRTEVTQREFESVTGYNPSRHRGADLPVENVTWWEAIRYCNLRSAREGLQPAYDLATGECNRSANGYRLPFEDEWVTAYGAGKPAGNLRQPGTKDVAVLVAQHKRGTVAVASSTPNERGLHDMTGNVWEWCNDRYSAVAVPDSVSAPLGPATGPDRVIRGGSFLSGISSWNRGLRSSRDPNAASPYTGFRVARSTGAPDRPPLPPPLPAFASVPATGLSTVTAADLPAVRERWLRIVGAPNLKPAAPSVRVIEEVEDAVYSGQLLDLQTEPDSWERVFVMRPRGSGTAPRPVVIVPFYDVDTPAGRNMGGRRFVPPSVRSLAYVAVQRGWIAVAIRWFGESYGESYDEAVANLALRHPGCTGLGKWVWDSQRLLDYVAALPDVDPSRIGMIGHSLGGKMSLYAAAFDPRISAIVASEPGIGLRLSNYDDFWYLGRNIEKVPAGSDQHELLALIAPRPFLLIGGEDSDGDKSLPYMNAARGVYTAKGAPEALGFFNHRTGHSPTAEAVTHAMNWFERAFYREPR